MRIRILAIGVTVLAAAALAGCGGNDNSSSTTGAETTTSTSTTSSSGSTLTISETEYKLDPSDPTVAGAGSATIEVKNDGGTEHALEIEGNGLEEQRTDTLSPGDSATLTVDLKPGKYTIYCPIGNHRALGMKGTITVNS